MWFWSNNTASRELKKPRKMPKHLTIALKEHLHFFFAHKKHPTALNSLRWFCWEKGRSQVVDAD